MIEFYAWWKTAVMDKYEVLLTPFSHYLLVAFVVGVVTAIILGVFYKPEQDDFAPHWIAKFGIPGLIIFMSGGLTPIALVLFLAALPILFVVSLGIAILLGVYYVVQLLDKRRIQHLRGQVYKLTQKRSKYE